MSEVRKDLNTDTNRRWSRTLQNVPTSYQLHQSIRQTIGRRGENSPEIQAAKGVLVVVAGVEVMTGIGLAGEMSLPDRLHYGSLATVIGTETVFNAGFRVTDRLVRKVGRGVSNNIKAGIAGFREIAEEAQATEKSIVGKIRSDLDSLDQKL